jgi:D-methionine transport system substrate-binding protein
MPEITDSPSDTEHGFELKKRRRWPFVLGGIVVVVAIGAAIVIPKLDPTKSANDSKGATLYVATAEGNAAEEALVDFVAAKVAPKYGIKIAFKGLADSNTINAAVNNGEVAGTVYQHKLWLGLVLEANPTFR